jgi:cytochrome c5
VFVKGDSVRDAALFLECSPDHCAAKAVKDCDVLFRRGELMKHLERFMLGLLLCAGTLTIGVAMAIGQTKSDSQQTQNKAAPTTARPATTSRGAKVFEQNCSRCHNAPEGFSPSVSGTIAKHMRVRANLSDADYKALRQFLNP